MGGNEIMVVLTATITLGRSVTRTPRRRELGQGRFSRPFSARPGQIPGWKKLHKYDHGDWKL